MDVCETERLVVRHLRPADRDDVAALTGDPVIARSMDDGEPLSRDVTRTWIDVSERNDRTRGDGCFAVTAKPENRMIGFRGFAFSPDQPGIVEVSYVFARAR